MQIDHSEPPVVPASSAAAVRHRDSGKKEGWQRTLESFGVPFVACGSDGALEVSAVAHVLLHGTSRSESVRAQAARLAREAATDGSRPVGTGQPQLIREVPAASDSLMLCVHVVQEVPARRRGVVVLRPAASDTQPPLDDGLTVREREVASLIAIGRATKEIAAALSISTHTARHHTERVFTKLGVQTRAAVAAIVSQRAGMGRSSHLLRATAAE